MAREDVRGERVERQVRILDRPHGIARIEADADGLGTCRLDQPFQLARLHVAGMILDRDLDPGVHETSAHALQDLDGVVDVTVDPVAPVLRTAKDRTHDRRLHDPRSVNHPAQLFFRRPLRLVEHRRGRTDRAHANLDVDLQLVGAGAHASQIVGLERAEESNLAEVHDLHVPLGCELELLERRPVLRIEAEHVDAEPDRRRGMGERRQSVSAECHRRGARGLEKRSAIGRFRLSVCRHPNHLKESLKRTRYSGGRLVAKTISTRSNRRNGRPNLGNMKQTKGV